MFTNKWKSLTKIWVPKQQNLILHVTYKILLMTSYEILKNENSISQNLVRLSAIDCIYNMQEYKTK